MATKNTSTVTVTSAKLRGRPAAKVKYPRGSFTVASLFAANATVVKWALSIRQHIEKGIEAGTITQLPKNVMTGKVGKPAHRFILTKNIRKAKVTKATPKVTETVATPTPVVETAPATVETAPLVVS